MPIQFTDLGLSPIALDLGLFELRWYALSYVAMLVIGWWYLRKLIARPGAPMSRAHADDIVTWIMIGVIAGGRLGYCLVYKPEIFATPWKVLELWNGGMSLHGGLAGVMLLLWWYCRRNKLQLLRVYDYIACCTPFGLFLVRLANFVNGELWGRPSNLPWAMVFPGSEDGIARHPSQLYEAFLEGGVAMLVLWYLFWKTDARYHPGRLLGTGLLLYGVTRFALEFTRQPDAGLENLAWHLTMGQTLCLPMIGAGAWLLWRSRTAPTSTARTV
ncbi:MAG: prolipoprotein diacylglyceryl transferase [Sphingomonadales bacterium]|nr:MAG: prolipoprotein diacylglyceryl transferase [Sphingomonadales bacterium]